MACRPEPIHTWGCWNVSLRCLRRISNPHPFDEFRVMTPPAMEDMPGRLLESYVEHVSCWRRSCSPTNPDFCARSSHPWPRPRTHPNPRCLLPHFQIGPDSLDQRHDNRRLEAEHEPTSQRSVVDKWDVPLERLVDHQERNRLQEVPRVEVEDLIELDRTPYAGGRGQGHRVPVKEQKSRNRKHTKSEHEDESGNDEWAEPPKQPVTHENREQPLSASLLKEPEQCETQDSNEDRK